MSPQGPSAVALASGLIGDGKLKEALQALSAEHPFEREAPAEVYRLLGFLGTLRQDSSSARKAVQEGLRRHPEDPGLLCSWGTLLWEEGERREALSAWERAFQRVPTWTRIDYLVAMATVGEPLSGPAPGVEGAAFRITPLYMTASEDAEWYSGELSRREEGWVLTLASGGKDSACRLLPGVRVLAVSSDANGLYARRAVVTRVSPSARAVLLDFMEPLHRIQRRRHVRILAHHIASGSVEGPDGKGVPLTVGSLSASGISFASPVAFPAGAKLKISLVVNPEGGHGPGPSAPPARKVGLQSLRLEAEVIRCRPQEKRFGVSVRFLISTRDQDTLARLIHLSQLNLRRIERDTR